MIKGKSDEKRVQFKEADSGALDKLVVRTTQIANGVIQISNLTKKVASKVERLEQEITGQKFEMQQTEIKLNETRKYEMEKMGTELANLIRELNETRKFDMQEMRTETANLKTELDAIKELYYHS